eukprot:scaffold596_cov236-Pinguiococcus_pyrenoidosus.AAC.18
MEKETLVDALRLLMSGGGGENDVLDTLALLGGSSPALSAEVAEELQEGGGARQHEIQQLQLEVQQLRDAILEIAERRLRGESPETSMSGKALPPLSSFALLPFKSPATPETLGKDTLKEKDSSPGSVADVLLGTAVSAADAQKSSGGKFEETERSKSLVTNDDQSDGTGSMTDTSAAENTYEGNNDGVEEESSNSNRLRRFRERLERRRKSSAASSTVNPAATLARAEDSATSDASVQEQRTAKLEEERKIDDDKARTSAEAAGGPEGADSGDSESGDQDGVAADEEESGESGYTLAKRGEDAVGNALDSLQPTDEKRPKLGLGITLAAPSPSSGTLVAQDQQYQIRGTMPKAEAEDCSPARKRSDQELGERSSEDEFQQSASVASASEGGDGTGSESEKGAAGKDKRGDQRNGKGPSPRSSIEASDGNQGVSAKEATASLTSSAADRDSDIEEGAAFVAELSDTSSDEVVAVRKKKEAEDEADGMQEPKAISVASESDSISASEEEQLSNASEQESESINESDSGSEGESQSGSGSGSESESQSQSQSEYESDRDSISRSEGESENDSDDESKRKRTSKRKSKRKSKSDDEGRTARDAPRVWQRFYDEDYEQYYFHNSETGQTTWTRPEGVNDSDIETVEDETDSDVDAASASGDD